MPKSKETGRRSPKSASAQERGRHGESTVRHEPEGYVPGRRRRERPRRRRMGRDHEVHAEIVEKRLEGAHPATPDAYSKALEEWHQIPGVRHTAAHGCEARAERRGRGGEGEARVSLNGTVWSPMGPSPIAEGSTKDNGLVLVDRHQSEQPERHLYGHGGRRCVAHERRRHHVDARDRPPAFAGHRRAGGHRDGPEQR